MYPGAQGDSQNLYNETRGVSWDQIQGSLAGVMLGDSLGHPHEFDLKSLPYYTGKLEFIPVSKSQWQGIRMSVIGQVTDDSEMTLTLANSIIRNNGYYRDDVILSYEEWANSNNPGMGRNTRLLFQGVKTIKGYETRFSKAITGELKGMKHGSLPEVQSNGSLMRAAPLALLPNINDAVADTTLTNPNPVNVECTIIYVRAIQQAYQGIDASTIFRTALTNVVDDDIREALEQVSRGEVRNVSPTRGWVVHGIYCAFVVMANYGRKKSFRSFRQAIDWVIRLGGDTDTNGAIAGGLLGAYIGFNQMIEDKVTHDNIFILLNHDPSQGDFPRADKYHPKTMYEVSRQLAEIYA